MADNDTQSKIHYDDFIASVQPDPAKAVSTIMMSGYIGHGADGSVRIYPDPTLGDWYDVAEADIVHSLPHSDSPLGGSYIWIRAGADIKPGAAGSEGGDAGGADAGGDAAPGAAQAAVRPGGGLGGVGPTIDVRCVHPVQSIACNLSFFHCPPPPPPPHVTQQAGCTAANCAATHFNCAGVQALAAAPQIGASVGPPCEVTIVIDRCPPHLSQACTPVTQFNCHTILACPHPQAQQALAAGPQLGQIHPTTTVLTLQPTPATHCFICPPRTIVTETCTPGVGCTYLHCVHPTPTANPTPATLCSPPAICNQAVSPNCPGPGPGTPVQQQGQAQQFGAAQPAMNQWPTPATHCFVCPPPGQAQAQAPNFTIGAGCTFICAQQPAQQGAPNQPTPASHCFVCDAPAAQNIRPTGPLVCSETCNTLLAGCATLPNNCVPQTLPNVCQVQTALPGCQTHPTVATICSETCNTHLLGCPTQNVFQCTGTQAQICHVQPTAATICSETCNTHLLGCGTQNVFQCAGTQAQICHVQASPNCPGPGPGTPVQQPGAPAQQQGFAGAAALQPTPSAVGQCGGGGVGGIQPTPSALQHCGNTVATLCTQNLCHSFVDCTIIGCTHIGCTNLLGCQQHPTVATICSETCNTHLLGCHSQNVLQCLPQTLPQICTIVASPNCPGPGPGTPVQQPGTPVQQQGFGAAAALQPTPSALQHCGNTAATVCSETCNTLLLGCATLPINCVPRTLPNVCQIQTALPGCHTHPTVATICSETCNTHLLGCHTQNVFQCLPGTQPQICNIVASPNCPGPGPGTPVQQPGFGAVAALQPTPSAVGQCGGGVGGVQPTPSAVQHCGGNTAATVCTQPAVCHPSVNVVCPTPSAVHQCGGYTVALGCTHPPACHASANVICPTPSAVHQCGGGNTAATACHPSVNAVCPTPSAVQQCGAAQAPQAQAPQAQAFSPVTFCNCSPPAVCTHAGCQPTAHCTPATVCTRPPACPVHPSVNVICPTPSAVHQCGGGNTAATVCHPSVNAICPTPSAVHQCGGNTAATVCTQPAACHPSVNAVCPTPSAVQQCGVFTPFCPQ